ncbi:MAG: chromosomal replication initiator protein DnaA [Firmicutes bacterium]|jgi:chromosomal replication initiator protein|nr:chromosomal replication initiator protein DnaA [Candidatus Fermentithermobacillaceae bacterium]
MSRNLEQAWADTLTRAAARLSTPSFSWLKDTRPATLKANTLTVTVPSEFARNWIESHYKEELTRAWKETWGSSCDLKFTVVAQEKVVASALFPAEATLPRERKRRSSEDISQYLRGLNPRYVFENFIVGASNRFAHAAALAVSEAPSKVYNPLFIYGGVGLGKTHLMQAIAHYVLDHHPGLKVCYVSSETFTNELILAIQEGTTAEFRNRYRGVDVLLIDDIQFVAGKDATQEEFFHTFDALHQATKQIIISSDRPPKEISTLEERLRTRFEWGLICDIQPPDIETRMAILRKKAEIEGREVPIEVCQYIAERIPSNIRELEGALIRVLAFTGLQKKLVTLEVTKEVLHDLLPSRKPVPITIDMIKKVVAQHYSLDLSDFSAKRRTRNVAFPRQVAMYLCRQLTDASLPRIGEQFGGRDHTTVLHACDKVDAERKANPALDDTLNMLIAKIKEG